MSIKILVALLPVIAVICACGDRGDDLSEPSESEKAEIRGKIAALGRQVGFDVVIPPSFPSDLNPVPATDHVPRPMQDVAFLFFSRRSGANSSDRPAIDSLRLIEEFDPQRVHCPPCSAESSRATGGIQLAGQAVSEDIRVSEDGVIHQLNFRVGDVHIDLELKWIATSAGSGEFPSDARETGLAVVEKMLTDGERKDGPSQS